MTPGPAEDSEDDVPPVETVLSQTTGSAPVGRRNELLVLEESLRLARTSARIVSLAGEPWVGKSRLLAELIAVAREDGWTVAAGRAGRLGGSVPFEVFVDALDDRLARIGPGLAARLGPREADRLAGVFPALAAGRREPPAPAPADPDAYWLLRAMRALIGRAAGTDGLLLVLDDVHRADPLSLQLLDHLVRHPPEAPVLIALAFRDSPTARHLSSLRSLRAHGAVPSWRHLDIVPLAERDAAALLPAGLDPIRRQLLLRDAAGVPGLLHALRDAGRLPVNPDAASVDFRALSPEAWRTACAAAVLGDPFTPGPVAEVAELPLERVLGAVDDLQSEGLIRPDGHLRRFRFRHPAVAGLVLRATDAGWRYGAQGRAVRAAAPTAAVPQSAMADAMDGEPLTAGLPDGPGAVELASLSRREVQVAVLVSAGFTNQQIAGRMQLSPKTVETYLSRIFKKLGVVSRTQVAHLVGRGGRHL
ncbi:LuxR family transcriptional regulator [Streptomyces sp. SPB162]|uniref:helix-turn-helix transcriptional regulator n=1 Tax=Streptomyces sp. SPB162 TaxID=2940560 RepID=UPI002405714A|nr:LuxR family transcriptional regulator [Streptomyces sp. SPB162]MDF9815641.1 DNA-binding CsgD family transcriptional regulator [Streptomyces sp. SPB162]